MFRLSVADYVLWLLPQLCVCIVLVRIMRNNIVRDFPYFAAYCLLQLVRFTALFAIGFNHRVAYFFTYWPLEIFDVLLSIAVIRDIYWRSFRNYPALRTFGVALFHWALALSILISAVTAAGTSGKDLDRITVGVLVFDQVGAVVRGGLLLLLLCIALFFRLRWNYRQLGVVIGFSIYVIVELAAVSMRRYVGVSGGHAYSLISNIAYNCCCGVWVWIFARQRSDAADGFPYSASELDSWNSSLQSMVR